MAKTDKIYLDPKVERTLPSTNIKSALPRRFKRVPLRHRCKHCGFTYDEESSWLERFFGTIACGIETRRKAPK